MQPAPHLRQPPPDGSAQPRRGLPPLLAAREAERLRISRELHDELGPQLLALRLELGRIARAPAGEDGDSPAVLRQRLRGLLPVVDGTVSAVRRVAADLRPPDWGSAGLVPALQAFSRQWSERVGIPLEFEARPPALRHNDGGFMLGWAVYRITQEALTNVARHAFASRVELGLEVEDGWLVLHVRDDGLGMRNTVRPARQGLGLRGMRERAESCGGVLEVGNAPGGGCIVVARLPLDGTGRPATIAGEVN